MKTCLTTILTITILLTANNLVSAQGIDAPSPDLPPPGQYVSPDEYHTYLAAGIVLDDPVHDRFTNIQRETVGTDELETFDSFFSAVEINGGPLAIPGGLGPITLTGPVQVRVHDRTLSTAGLFDTEIVSMSLSGNVPGMGLIQIREDPYRASTGQTDILDLGGGLYHIDSFFDVFTELSVDGGASWIASDDRTRMYLTPEPATLAVLALGAIAALIRRR